MVASGIKKLRTRRKEMTHARLVTGCGYGGEAPTSEIEAKAQQLRRPGMQKRKTRFSAVIVLVIE